MLGSGTVTTYFNEWHYCASAGSTLKKSKIKTQTKKAIVSVNCDISNNSVRVECKKSFSFANLSFCDTFITTKKKQVKISQF